MKKFPTYPLFERRSVLIGGFSFLDTPLTLLDEFIGVIIVVFR